MKTRTTASPATQNHAAEFDRQVQALLAKDYPALLAMPERDFTALLAPLHDVAAQLPPSGGDRLPFVIVIPGVPVADAVPLLDLKGKPGFTTMEREDIQRFDAIEGIELPGASAYLITDVDTGAELLNVTPNDALPAILAAQRSPLTLAEGVALVTQYPEVLKERNAFSMLGSRSGDKRVTALWISEKRPRLGWCWAGNPHTWLGSASCGARVA
jgi:hypothetical protein